MLGILLAGVRISEIDQQPIIEVTSHVAMVSLDDLGAGFVTNRRCNSRVLGIDPCRERGQPHEFASHDR